MSRRYPFSLSCLGLSQLSRSNPLVIAWWSAAFPGYGHMLINMHIKGNILILFEVIINLNAHLNQATAYSFSGQFELAKEVLNSRWALIYIPFYFFCIFDSYRSAKDINQLCLLTEQTPVIRPIFEMKSYSLSYLDKRSPRIAMLWSLFLPGTGELYCQRTITALSLMIWTLVITYFSHSMESLQWLLTGNIDVSKRVLDMEWLLFIPSLHFGAAYDAYRGTLNHNHFFVREQKDYLRRKWPVKRAHPLFPENGWNGESN
ncbi:hypothetical protein [Sporolactobacillus vineae]|uniref:hypothetical protein n=1 Tax=Sporolactobacillus vineae TaxID=444463 RepID=UPI00035ECF2F|nr:hypothetical protein [Sporolactobacillus vineae]